MTDEEWNKYVEKVARGITVPKMKLTADEEWERRLAVKAEVDRQISRWYTKQGMNHAKLK